MQHIKLLGLSLTVALAVCAVVVGEASAAEDVYKVGGTRLETGEVIEIGSTANTEFTFKVKGVLEVEAVVKCKKLKLDVAEGPVIVGGTPGTSEQEKFELEECSATIGGSKCEKVALESALLDNELVTVVLPTGKAGGLATVFRPASGTVVMTSKLTKCGIFGTQEAKVEGDTGSGTSFTESGETIGTWLWNEKEEITEVEKSNGTKEKVGLKSDAKVATLNVEATIQKAKYLEFGPKPEPGAVGIGEPLIVNIKNQSKKVELKITFNDTGGLPFSRNATTCGNMLGKGAECKDEITLVEARPVGTKGNLELTVTNRAGRFLETAKYKLISK